jgi:hypothetical protein
MLEDGEAHASDADHPDLFFLRHYPNLLFDARVQATAAPE